jgi:pentatricopeptide repeat protein
MHSYGVRADTCTYNTLINACAGVGDVDKALETLAVMQSDEHSQGQPGYYCEPDVITYTSLIKACSINGSPGMVAMAEQFFREMQQRTNHFSNYVSPTEYTYLRLIQTHLACPEEGDIARVWELWDLLTEHQQQLSNGQAKATLAPTPSIYALRTGVQAALFERDVDRALGFLDDIRGGCGDSSNSDCDSRRPARPHLHGGTGGYNYPLEGGIGVDGHVDEKSWLLVAEACEAHGRPGQARALRVELAEHSNNDSV